MTNEQIISKMKDDMKMRGFSHWTEESYLLILAGVTIATLFRDNGIITRANEAVQTNTEAEEKERISLAWQSLYLKKRQTDGTLSEITAEELEEQLIEDGATEVTATGSGTLKVTFSHPDRNNIYTINQDGVISKINTKWYKFKEDDKTIITDGIMNLNIGDYVDYNEQTGNIASYISKKEQTGYESDQTFTLSKLQKDGEY